MATPAQALEHEEAVRARERATVTRLVVKYARDRDDRDGLLDALGLIDKPPAEHKPDPPPEPDTGRPAADQKRCSRCRCVRDRSEFAIDRHRSDGLSARCRTCNAQRGRDRRRADSKETA